MIFGAIADLVSYAVRTNLIEEADRVWAVNVLLEELGLPTWEETAPRERPLEQILQEILDWAVENGRIADGTASRDLFDTKLMGRLTPRPGEVRRTFWEKYRRSPEEATDWYYAFSQNTDYIRRYRVARDWKWVTSTPYGDLDITVNLSKPEKDPRAIAAAKTAPQSGYPKCLLCRENEGFAGDLTRPARQNHRVVPVTIDQTDWFFQYSPYVYYPEHCIVFNGQHVPMRIDRSAFRKLLDFVKQFPHYFVGSNADLPIVGGSILSHDHFQGGRYTFAMERAPVERAVSFPGFTDVEAGIVQWPMSVLRLRCEDDERLVDLAEKVLNRWRNYTDPAAIIFAETDGEPHNTITPIARKRDGKFELDLVLRNNLTTKDYPLGLYHPHPELHHIKKENIGLIEVMGLAVLPARLKTELSALARALTEGRDIRGDEALAKHADWAEEVQTRHTFTRENAMEILQNEVGAVFATVLEHAGVYKCTKEGRRAFLRFLRDVK
ncbi:UDP-glucose--hexose-1-phosphate uridylyltransferase [Oscillibacter sp.]|uniref:UDP-glucose--hexose-1-phosphate uridylyltransferase n=1 Tax=Oscillibacter sp. TaxID=1945593 RepID=UPI00263156ED|nr:UDP-glucose--hexose-1-phosphate uridylyltransferase [Oscillibacter sp.]MDD3346106.1 UDP-glucose--hexose-1-phosphate uridylyltransferase [Oscillibacter sp.]